VAVRRDVGGAAPAITIEVQATRLDAPAGTGAAAAAAETSAWIDEFDPDFREKVRPAFQFLHDRYWRVETTGVARLPERGPAILVSNHSGALPFDGAMIVTALALHREISVRFLYDPFVENIAPVSSFYRKLGGIPATRQNALAALRAGQTLLIFPEGVPGVAKPFSDRYRLRSFNPGFARLAFALDVPVVPIAVVGAEEIYPLVGRAEGVGKALGMPYLPITPFFPVLGPLGAVPLPTKWFIRVGKPIRLAPAEGEQCRPRARIEAARMRRTIQAMLARVRARRRSVFFG
jgi:1-acyl-sn-glycerol-3-phosphate acyltransferase